MGILTYQYRIYPNKTQSEFLDRCFSMGWRIWNDALHMRKMAYETEKKSIPWQTLGKSWGEFRRDNPELQILPFDTVTNVIIRLDKAYAAFFRRIKAGDEKAGFPNEKKRHEFNSLEYRHGKGCKFIAEKSGVARLYISGADNIRVHYHRPFPCGATVKQVVIKRERSEWYASFQLEMDTWDKDHQGKAVGIDIGMVYLLALSDGTVFENPRWYREGLPELRILSRTASRRAKVDSIGRLLPNQSKNYWDARHKVTEHHSKVARQREYYWNVVTDWLTKTYSLIALEDLTLGFMIKNKSLAMSANDASFGTFWQMLKYKAERTGTKLVFVPPQYTSQTCSECGYIDAGNRKTQAAFKCVSCGHQENADINAARNILNLALNAAVQPAHGVTQAIGSNVP